MSPKRRSGYISGTISTDRRTDKHTDGHFNFRKHRGGFNLQQWEQQAKYCKEIVMGILAIDS